MHARPLATIASVLVIAACGGTVETSGDAGQDSASDPVDTSADSAADTTADTGELVPCTRHEECLVEDYCGPCVSYSCPCDPETDPSCTPHCVPNPCHDGMPASCLAPIPECPPWEVLTVVDECYACLNVETCRPWGEPGCDSDSMCAPEDYCNDCARGSCPMCEDCVADCTPHGCPTESEALCDMARPDCPDGGFSVIRDGCWICVTPGSCSPMD